MEKNRKVEISTIISKGSKIEGTLTIKGGIRVDGTVEGTLKTDGFLHIGKTGHAKAEVQARECLIHGKVEGDIVIQESLELESTALITGNIHARVLRVHEGAVLNGNCSMGENPVRLQEQATRGKPNLD